MNVRGKSIQIGAALLVGLWCATILASATDRQVQQDVIEELGKRSLQDCGGVYVVVDIAWVDEKDYDRLREQLLKDVKSKLNDSGIKVLTSAEYMKSRRRPTLYISILQAPRPEPISDNMLLPDEALFARTLIYRIQHVERAHLVRSNLSTFGICWDSGLELAPIRVGGTAEMHVSVEPQLREYIEDYLKANDGRASGGIDSIPAERMTWLMCRNGECEHTVQIQTRQYYQQMEDYMRTNPSTLQAPGLGCQKCGESSAYRAFKCKKCGQIFEGGLKPGDFEDRCPKCGTSTIEEQRKNASMGRAKVMATMAMLRQLHSAAGQFKMDTGRYPSEAEGLTALVEEPSGVSNYASGGYLKTTTVPSDSWGNEYIYMLYPESGKPYVIVSYGADGKPGGTGYDKDLFSTDF